MLACDPDVGQEEELGAGPKGMEEIEGLSKVGTPVRRPLSGLRDPACSEAS